MNQIVQCEDDIKLLEQMWQEQSNADALYQPGNYWQVYAQTFLPELRLKGLKNFRSRRFSIMGSFGATDLSLYNITVLPQVLKKMQKTRFIWRYVPCIINLLEGLLSPFRKIFELQFNSSTIAEYFYALVERKLEQKGWRIENFSMSLIGAPEERISIEGKMWSRSHLEMLNIFSDALLRSKFSQEGVFVEIGPGIGRNAEFFAAAYPNATIILFDIVPQLYVLNQYLKKRFLDRFIPYEESIKLDPNGKTYEGKIVLLPTWFLPKWSSLKIDYFWNSASFQEMEPHIVVNYLTLIKQMQPEWIYINALPKGNYWGEWKPGQGGTKEPVSAAYYDKTLKDQYSLKDTYWTDYILRRPDYMSYLYKRN